jgi:hypothetical protein
MHHDVVGWLCHIEQGSNDQQQVQGNNKTIEQLGDKPTINTLAVAVEMPAS